MQIRDWRRPSSPRNLAQSTLFEFLKLRLWKKIIAYRLTSPKQISLYSIDDSELKSRACKAGPQLSSVNQVEKRTSVFPRAMCCNLVRTAKVPGGNHLYRRCLCTVAPRPWLFVGLGNPGDKYRGTRHNVGFEMIDAFAESHGIPMNTVHCKAIFGQGFVGEVPVFLAKPQTYMNLSGESAGPMAAYYKLPLDRVLVIHDDMNLPCGVLRLHDKGGHGSHNGLKSVIYHFRGNREFPRFRIGIGRPPGQMDPKAFLLQKFNVAARQRIDDALEEGIEALKLLLSKGLTESARRFNKEQKYKHMRVQTLPV